MDECLLNKIIQFLSLIEVKKSHVDTRRLMRGEAIQVIDESIALCLQCRKLEKASQNIWKFEMTAKSPWLDSTALNEPKKMMQLFKELNPIKTKAHLLQIFFNSSHLFLSWKPPVVVSAQQCFELFNLQKIILQRLKNIKVLQ